MASPTKKIKAGNDTFLWSILEYPYVMSYSFKSTEGESSEAAKDDGNDANSSDASGGDSNETLQRQSPFPMDGGTSTESVGSSNGQDLPEPRRFGSSDIISTMEELKHWSVESLESVLLGESPEMTVPPFLTNPTAKTLAFMLIYQAKNGDLQNEETSVNSEASAFAAVEADVKKRLEF